MKPLDAPAELVAPAAITSAFGLMGVVLVELMGFVLVETMLALLLTLSDPPTQPAFKAVARPSARCLGLFAMRAHQSGLCRVGP